jgi:LysR family transcriptional regulator, transcriptional activator for dmlA
MSLTPEGETYLADGARLLHDLETLERAVAGSEAQPKGLLKVGATLGFGRRKLAPVLATFAERYPEIELQMHLSERPVNVLQTLVEKGFDVVIRFGDMPDAQLTTRLLARSRRLLCASPGYLLKAGAVMAPRELTRHACLFIREGDEAFGTWTLRNGAKQETVKVRGPLSTNDGESATEWALSGHGIVMRSEWEIAPLLRSGRLQAVLPDWRLPQADIHVVYARHRLLSSKIRALVGHLLDAFKAHRELTHSSSNW